VRCPNLHIWLAGSLAGWHYAGKYQTSISCSLCNWLTNWIISMNVGLLCACKIFKVFAPMPNLSLMTYIKIVLSKCGYIFIFISVC
jgi:hypothetical protein